MTSTKAKLILIMILIIVFSFLIFPFYFFYHFKPNLIFIIKHYNFKVILACLAKDKILFLELIAKSFLTSFLLIGVAEVCSFLQRLFFDGQNIHGKARFANFIEIKDLLKEKNGIVIGEKNNKLLKFSGQQFVAVSAPTRSGKGASFVIPNLIEWEQSVVVLDIPKLEAYSITSKYRKEVLGQKVYLFSPFNENTSKYNPLDYVDFHSKKADIQLEALANILYSKPDFWHERAKELFIGLAFFTFELFSQKIINKFSLAQILICSTRIDNTDFEKYYKKNKANHSDDATLRIDRILSTSDNTKSSIIAVFTSGLSVFANKIIAENTSSSDFNLNDLRKEKITIYIGFNVSELITGRPLINMLFSQLIEQNTRELPEQNTALKYQCLVVLDEFSLIGKMEILKKGSAFIAGYNLRLLTIFQSLSQLQDADTYGKEGAKTIMTNHAVQVVFAPKEQLDANEYSERLGYKDLKVRNWSRNTRRTDRNISQNTQKRALLLPQEIKKLDYKKEIIFIENKNPILCNKSLYFKNNYYIKKLALVTNELNMGNSREIIQKGDLKLDFKELDKNWS